MTFLANPRSTLVAPLSFPLFWATWDPLQYQLKSLEPLGLTASATTHVAGRGPLATTADLQIAPFAVSAGSPSVAGAGSGSVAAVSAATPSQQIY